jgi:uncharacterized protein YqeY
MTPAEERLRARLSAALTAALKARAVIRVAALRSVIAALDNATAIDADTVPFATTAEVPRRELSAQEVAALVAKEAAERQAAAAKLQSVGRAQAADRLLAEGQVIAEYLAVEAASEGPEP